MTGTPARWYWYIGRETELLLDLDSSTAVWYAVQKLRRNMRREFLPVSEVHLFRSLAPDHFHMFVILKQTMPAMERAIWECQLMSDLKRVQYNLMRSLRGLSGADLLITDRVYSGVRQPDYTCDCAAKHKRRRITNHCPILNHLHGAEAGAEYFAIKRDRKQRTTTLKLPIGKIPLSTILQS